MGLCCWFLEKVYEQQQQPRSIMLILILLHYSGAKSIIVHLITPMVCYSVIMNRLGTQTLESLEKDGFSLGSFWVQTTILVPWDWMKLCYFCFLHLVFVVSQGIEIEIVFS
jgi:uncharacterized membrane protein